MKRTEYPTTTAIVRGQPLIQLISNDMLKFLAEQAAYLEPETLDWIDGFPEGAVFYDIGASTGLFSLYAARSRRCSVIAFEPESLNFAALQVNIWLNRQSVENLIQAFPVAVSASNGVGRIFCGVHDAGYHMKILDKPVRVGETREFVPDHVQTVLRFTLDSLIASNDLAPPAYLKIDVDGAERDVIDGARAVLASHSLRSLMIELHDPDGASSDIDQAIRKNGFSLYRRENVRHARGGYYDGLYNCFYKR